MDFKKLSEVTADRIADSSREGRQSIIDRVKRRRAILKHRRAVVDGKVNAGLKFAGVSDSFKQFRVTDAYKNLKKKIKDDLEETETTDEAVETALSEITPEASAEQVLAAVVEVLGDTIDALQEDSTDNEDDVDDALGE